MTSTLTDRINGISTSVAIKAPCRVATTANITLSGLQSIDGVTVAADDRVLVKNQTDATENGIYTADTSAWERAEDFDGNRDAVNGTLVYVRAGSTNVGSWQCTATDPVTFGTSSISFTAASSETLVEAAAVAAVTGKQAIPVPASAMSPSSSGGCAALATVTTTANRPDIISLDFDPTAAEYAQFSIGMPAAWNEGTITARFRWSHPSTTTNFGVVWAIQAVAVGNDDTIDAAYGTAQAVTDTGGTTNDLYISDETPAVTVAGTPQAGDSVFFRVYRDAASGSDTLAVDARLLGVDLFITTSAATDD